MRVRLFRHGTSRNGLALITRGQQMAGVDVDDDVLLLSEFKHLDLFHQHAWSTYSPLNISGYKKNKKIKFSNINLYSSAHFVIYISFPFCSTYFISHNAFLIFYFILIHFYLISHLTVSLSTTIQTYQVRIFLNINFIVLTFFIFLYFLVFIYN